MSEALVVRTDPADPERVQWLENGSWQAGDWAALPARVAGAPGWVLLVDAGRVTLLETTLPVSDLGTARRAAPFAVEEQLAQPLEHTHLTVTALGGNTFGVAACRREDIEQLEQRLRTAGLHPDVVAPEVHALPWQEGGLTVAVTDGEALVRHGASAGIKVDLADLATVVAQLREQHPQTARVAIHARRDDTALPTAAFAGLETAWYPPLEARGVRAALAAPGTARLIDASPAALARGRARRLWLAAAVAALLALVAYPVVLAHVNARLAASAGAIDEANLGIFSSAFPAISRVVNPRVQAEQAVAVLRAQAATTPRFLDLLYDFEQAFATQSGEHTRVRSIAYADGVLEIALETSDMAELERVRTALGSAGLGAEMLSAESTDAGVLARLRLREPT